MMSRVTINVVSKVEKFEFLGSDNRREPFKCQGYIDYDSLSPEYPAAGCRDDRSSSSASPRQEGKANGAVAPLSEGGLGYCGIWRTIARKSDGGFRFDIPPLAAGSFI
jgi:hypothetical protein